MDNNLDTGNLRGNSHGERNERTGRDARGRRARRKVCNFCVDKNSKIDYKEAFKMRRFMSERAKILPRRITGTCARHQRILMIAIKRARFLGLLPYVNE